MNIKSTFIRKRNNNYNVYIEYIDEEGKIRQKSQGKYKNKKDAEKHLIDLKSSINNNKFIISKDITFVDRCSKFVEDNKYSWSVLTTRNRKSLISKHIEKHFDNVLLKDINPTFLQGFINQIYKEHVTGTADVIYSFVRTVLKESYRLKEINENPCDFIKMPNKKYNSTSDVYTREETKELIEKLEGENIQAPIMLMTILGLRYCEACGLRWQDIDFDNNIVNVNQIIVYLGKEGFIFKNPKTEKSKRALHAPDELMKILKKVKIKQGELQLKGLLRNEYDLICLNAELNPWSNTAIRKTFKRFLKKNNMKTVRLHDLRHTNATMMLLSGTNMKIVSERLGHTDIKLSMNRYSHVIKEMDKKASDNLSNILFK